MAVNYKERVGNILMHKNQRVKDSLDRGRDVALAEVKYFGISSC